MSERQNNHFVRTAASGLSPMLRWFTKGRICDAAKLHLAIGQRSAVGLEPLAKEVSSDRNTACISSLTHMNMHHSALAEGLP